jgi:hypothetical protein
MMQLYQSLVTGILGWPYLELPFSPYGKAMAARRQLVGMFQDVVNEARGKLAKGEELSGVVGSLVAAEDEEGNRWAACCQRCSTDKGSDSRSTVLLAATSVCVRRLQCPTAVVLHAAIVKGAMLTACNASRHC